MKQFLSRLLGHKISALDGVVGTIQDFYFDDHSWALRYLVCRLSDWDLSGSVLVPATFFQPKDWDLPLFRVSVSTAEVRACPGVLSDPPVSRQKLSALNSVWPDPVAGGVALMPPSFGEGPVELNGNPRLRSFRAVRQYDVATADTILGRCRDFIIDEDSWRIGRVVVRLKKSAPVREVSATIETVEEISWDNAAIYIKRGPVEWTPI